MMKYIYALIIVCTVNVCYSQRISIEPQMEKIGDDYRQSFKLFIPHSTVKAVSKEWSGFMKDHKGRVKSSNGQLSATNVLMPSVYNDTLQVDAKIVQDPDGVILFAAFSADEINISPTTHPAESETINRMLHDFALPLSKEGLENKISAAEKLFNASIKESEEVAKRNERLAADNEKMKDQIRDNEREIKDNEGKISTLKSQISDNKTALDSIKMKGKELE
jgi:hypothetical protein